MVKTKFSTSWKESTQPRKQRKYRFNAPLHVKQRFLQVHLLKDLRTKYGARNCRVRVGDKIKVLRGSFAKKEGKVERVSIKYGRVYVTGLDYIKKNGKKVLIPFEPSNLMITELDLSDKRRKQKLELKTKGGPAKSKPAKVSTSTGPRAASASPTLEKKSKTVKAITP